MGIYDMSNKTILIKGIFQGIGEREINPLCPRTYVGRLNFFKKGVGSSYVFGNSKFRSRFFTFFDCCKVRLGIRGRNFYFFA